MAVNWPALQGVFALEGVVLKLAAAIAVLAALQDMHFDDNGVLVDDTP